MFGVYLVSIVLLDIIFFGVGRLHHQDEVHPAIKTVIALINLAAFTGAIIAYTPTLFYWVLATYPPGVEIEVIGHLELGEIWVRATGPGAREYAGGIDPVVIDIFEMVKLCLFGWTPFFSFVIGYHGHPSRVARAHAWWWWEKRVDYVVDTLNFILAKGAPPLDEKTAVKAERRIKRLRDEAAALLRVKETEKRYREEVAPEREEDILVLR